ncbi:MAG TPA: tRNA lysidine(34) synthetase TilS [Burkholderiales bacterium]|jgi:tRNA(Ile)-lysidine synthase|nr:tRNA lysidine(34) synthetase TilS [Burkholderiales bacterium]
MTERLLEIVSAVLETHAVRGRRVAVGLSGGVDSVVLLDVLGRLRNDWRLALSAAHVNHQINAHALEWEGFCKTLCEARGVALTVRRVKVPRDGSGLEAAARDLRYQAYGGLEADFVALAHHLDDQVETFLLQLLRGAGPKGLAAMPTLRKAEWRKGKDEGGRERGKDEGGRMKAEVEQDRAKRDTSSLILHPSSLDSPPSSFLLPPCILRPLLEVTRSEIEAYAKARKLEWIEDDSNADSRYERNFLRNELLPRLEARFPAYRETLSRASRNLADYSELAEELAALDARAFNEGKVPVESLRELSDARALNLLRRLFSSRGLPMPNRTRLEEALRQCRAAGADSEVHVFFGSHGLRCFRGQVGIVEEFGAMPVNWNTRWDGRRELLLPAGLGVLRARAALGEGIAARHFAQQGATVRGRSGGERMRPADDRPRRTLKNLLQETAVPPWERERMPLLFIGDALAWVPGIGVAAEFRAARDEQGIVPEWKR